MPIITVNLKVGRSLEQKRALIEGITKVVCETALVKPASVRIIINEMQNDNFAIGGVLVCDDPARQIKQPEPEVKP